MPQLEGGGPHPPYKESFLENIVNVSWQELGGVFVSGDECCYQRYTRLEDNKSFNFKWLGLGSLAFGDGGTTVASSYGFTKAGKPTFLIGGSGHGGGVLMMSNDGYKWTNVQAGPVMGNHISNLVWDKEEKRFYCDVGEGMRPYYSDDGTYWYYSGTHFADHCKNPLGAPDGVYGYDKSQDVVIYPTGDGAVAVVDASTPFAQEFGIWVGLDFVGAITYRGGIWMAGGSTGGDFATTVSLDGGNFWFYSTVGAMNMTGNYEIFTMVSAPLRDFKKAAPASTASPVNVSRFPVTSPVATAAVAAVSAATATPMTRSGDKPDASQPQRPKLGPLASAVTPPRRPRVLLRGTDW